MLPFPSGTGVVDRNGKFELWHRLGQAARQRIGPFRELRSIAGKTRLAAAPSCEKQLGPCRDINFVALDDRIHSAGSTASNWIRSAQPGGCDAICCACYPARRLHQRGLRIWLHDSFKLRR